MISQREYDELWALIKEVKVGMLVSRDGPDLRARPMYTVQSGFNGRLYFFTDRAANKVDEIHEDSEVCVTYERPEEDVYVSCSGIARFVKDDALINRLWNPMIAAWFPEGKDSKNIGLIEVSIYRAEIWDTDKSDMVQLFELAKASLTDTQPRLGKNRKFG